MVSRDKTIGHALSLSQKRRTYGACATAFAIICTGVQQGNVTAPKEYEVARAQAGGGKVRKETPLFQEGWQGPEGNASHT